MLCQEDEENIEDPALDDTDTTTVPPDVLIDEDTTSYSGESFPLCPPLLLHSGDPFLFVSFGLLKAQYYKHKSCCLA